jgi:serine/threonine protein kinase
MLVLIQHTAPEVTDSLHNASKASDIFSLGVMLFEMLSRRRPFGKHTRTREDPNPVLQLAEDLPSGIKLDDLEALLQLMVAYTPHDRPQDVTDVLSVLDELNQSTKATVVFVT